MEFAGSLGDLGTLLPLSAGMILINGLDPVAVFIGVGLFYIATGLYFRVTCPVEPMKVISGYAIATGIGAGQIQSSCLWLALILLIIGLTGMITVVGRHIPRAVIRGVQLSTGLLLVSQGVKLMLGTSSFQLLKQTAEPYLRLQQVGFLPMGLLLGLALGALTLLLLDNRRVPAALVTVALGLLIGLVFGNQVWWAELDLGLHLPSLLPYGLPTLEEFGMVAVLLVAPQIPMTLGNAVIANADLSHQYFAEEGRRVTCKALCISMALANFGSFLIGGMPMCHGAGGLASRYRFGARSGGSNLIIGIIFVLVALLFGAKSLVIINLLPLSVLGVLLLFAGAQLALTLLDVQQKKDLFVVVLIVGITMASNLAAGFLVGIVLAKFLQWERFSV